MTFTFPFRVGRPTKSYDGADFGETMPSSDFVTIWGEPIIGTQNPSIEIHADEDVRVGDYVRLPRSLDDRR